VTQSVKSPTVEAQVAIGARLIPGLGTSICVGELKKKKKKKSKTTFSDMDLFPRNKK